MSRVDPNYRENCGRCIFIRGTITQELIDRVTPEIFQLRKGNNEPITVYIDSPGGSTRLGAVLSTLLRTPTQDRIQSRIIAVVTGHAHSAAADLLASGDYAIAYPDAWIHYHGTRQVLDEAVTAETANF